MVSVPSTAVIDLSAGMPKINSPDPVAAIAVDSIRDGNQTASKNHEVSIKTEPEVAAQNRKREQGDRTTPSKKSK